MAATPRAISLSLTPTIGNDVAAPLEGLGLLSAPVNNKRKVSVACLSPPASSSSRSLSSTSVTSESFAATATNKEADFIDIPEFLYSKETYVFLGFTEEVAGIMWQKFLSQPSESLADDEVDFRHFIEYPRARLDDYDIEDALTTSDDWDICLSQVGVNEKLHDAIMMPTYSDLRSTASCKFWVRESIEDTWASLLQLEEELRLESARLQREAARRKTRKHAGSISEAPSQDKPHGRKHAGSLSEASAHGDTYSKKPDDEQKKEQGKQGIEPATPSKMSADDSKLETGTLKHDAPARMEGHTMLWRGGAHRRHKAFYDFSTQTAKITALESSPGDFSHRGRSYFSPQHETADRYAQWAKHKSDITQVSILQVALPNKWVESLDAHYLWLGALPTDEWSQVVWHSRNGERFPKELRHVYNKDLLIGHIASGINEKYVAMDKPTMIKDKDVLKVESEGEDVKSIQWVFQSMKAEDGFETECKGKVWVHMCGCLKTPLKK
ncbi:uncharacterized protein K452DRAFT_310206 [Aplosporella prunicola CBS 121167]|uniref:Uncharacterized protein n=1 Tax=Aplosporella prunicola CBS 121167 TaxID=1176127 RepID=A0A6A6B9B0_9PEZI|nr:uncharacterized protein K452DRAFT_310206 [Aplosporella prunicola CBS 121167]KAF2139824.1 hypothetical protein K452DRAFT_310206 [Aplosporella prunicola CBS 121167]